LRIAAFLAPVVKFLMALFYIVARPIGLLLDAWLGTHDEDGKAPFNAKDLYTLLNLSRAGVINTPAHSVHHSDRLSRAPSILSGDLSTPFLDDDAVLIAQGALLSSKKTVKSLVKSSYHSVHGDEKITLDWLEGIGHSGYSRICVTQPSAASATVQQYLGYFVVKEILSDLKRYLSTSCSVKDLPIHPIFFFKETDSILVALNQLQSRKMDTLRAKFWDTFRWRMSWKQSSKKRFLMKRIHGNIPNRYCRQRNLLSCLQIDQLMRIDKL
jgi:CBS domain containing-hemolysin-like protein